MGMSVCGTLLMRIYHSKRDAMEYKKNKSRMTLIKRRKRLESGADCDGILTQASFRVNDRCERKFVGGRDLVFKFGKYSF